MEKKVTQAMQAMQEIFWLQSAFAITLLISELPSGYISDLIGRKKALFFAGVLHGVGFTIFPLADGVWLLVLAEIIMGISVRLFSGTDISLIYDSLEALGERKAPIKIVGRRFFYMQFSQTIAGLLGGWLVYLSLNTVAWIQAALAWWPCLFVFFITEPERKLMDKKKHKENFLYIYRSLFNHSRLLNYILLNSVVYSVATLVAVWTYQKYWLELNIPLYYFGYLWAGLSLIVAIVGRYAHKLEKKWGSTNVLILMGVLPIIGYFGMAHFVSFIGVLFAICFQVSRPINAIILSDGLNKRVTGDMRATANSVAGLGSRTLFIVLGPLAGYGIDRYGMSTTFYAFAIFYSLAFVLILLPLLRQRDSFIKIAK